MSKIKFAALGLAGFTVANLGLSTYAVTGDVKLNVNVDPAIALTIQSSSDGSTIYAESDPAGQVVNNYTGEGYTAFGVSSAKINMLPNTADESMWSKVTVYTNNTEGYKLTVSDTDDDTSLTTGTYTIPTGTTIAAGTSAWAFKGGKFADYTAMSPISSVLTIAESTTKSAADGDTTEIHYGVSTSADQATGTYSDTIVYTVTGEDVPTEPEEITMQNFTCSILRNVNDKMILTDTRDGNNYTVVKLADNNCWMTENLALNLDSNVTLTPEDTNIEENWTPIRSTVATGEMSVSDFHEDNTIASYASGDDEYGNYYNFTAAIAMNDSASTVNEYATTSICPKGWALPSSYTGLGAAYGLSSSGVEYNTNAADILTADPLNFKRAGFIGNLGDRIVFFEKGDYGSYWTSRAGELGNAAAMLIRSNEYRGANGYNRHIMLSVRCVSIN